MGYNMTDEEIKKCDSVEKLTKLGVPLNSALVINGVSKDLYQQYINEKLKEDIPDVLKDIFK